MTGFWSEPLDERMKSEHKNNRLMAIQESALILMSPVTPLRQADYLKDILVAATRHDDP